MVHAIAPGATIVELPFKTADANTPAGLAATLAAVVRIAVPRADVISLSGSLGEHFFTSAEVATIHSALQYAAARHVTFVASSGDNGAISDLGRADSRPRRSKRSACPRPIRAVGLYRGWTETASP